MPNVLADQPRMVSRVLCGRVRGRPEVDEAISRTVEPHLSARPPCSHLSRVRGRFIGAETTRLPSRALEGRERFPGLWIQLQAPPDPGQFRSRVK
jgi:hypothetical protein